MQSSHSRMSPVLPGAACVDVPVQDLEDWAATMDMMVATTLEPSCALAFCFRNLGFLSRRRPRVNSESSASDSHVEQLK